MLVNRLVVGMYHSEYLTTVSDYVFYMVCNIVKSYITSKLKQCNYLGIDHFIRLQVSRSS